MHSLALGAIAVHAVLNGLVAGLAHRAAGHLHSQTRLRAALDVSPQFPALSICAQRDKLSQQQSPLTLHT